MFVKIEFVVFWVQIFEPSYQNTFYGKNLKLDFQQIVPNLTQNETQ